MEGINNKLLECWSIRCGCMCETHGRRVCYHLMHALADRRHILSLSLYTPTRLRRSNPLTFYFLPNHILLIWSILPMYIYIYRTVQRKPPIQKSLYNHVRIKFDLTKCTLSLISLVFCFRSKPLDKSRHTLR